MAESSIKKSGVYGIFGKRYGDILINVLQGCCNGVADFGNVCTVVKDCIGISLEDGDETLFLNQKGEWVSSTGQVYTFLNTDSVALSESLGVVTASIILDPNPLNTLTISPTGLLNISSPTLNTTTEEFLDLNSGNSVTLSITPLSISVYRNGIRLSSTEYSLATNVVTFVDSFGLSGGAAGAEDVIIDLIY